ncbi:MAG: hypothetical protein CVU29_01205 [Betaproteobacteria bacterium HGW-Betaproteobacteria-22]|nr:MAG: hypothetical protein CVU29_01205 [Betaproteobacteria bacterium HGW-Betaproteobacteria-22]
MKFIILKYLITALLVVLASELAKFSDKLGALVTALPMVTILTLIWLFIEKQAPAKIANHAYYTFWYVIPTLPMFLLFPFLLPKWGFWPTLAASGIFTLCLFYVYGLILKQFNIHLW